MNAPTPSAPSAKASTKKLSTQRWMWLNLLRSALIPLLLVETGLIAIYLFSNAYIRDSNISVLRGQADEQLANTARLEVDVIDRQLQEIQGLTQVYRDDVQRLLNQPYPQVDSLPPEYGRTEEGVLFSKADNGDAASFYSGFTPPEQQDLGKVVQLEASDPLMLSIMNANPLVNAIYFNSWDSYNRIYPWFQTQEQYPPEMDIPQYNFYYDADAEHNPDRGVVWTEVYVDPAGQGWMMSAAAPVYRGDFLEGVVGIDITVETIVQQILGLDIPWGGYAVLLNRSGTIMALPGKGEQDFGLKELTEHSYQKAITEESFKPEQFNINTRDDTQALAEAIKNSTSGGSSIMLQGSTKRVAWQEIDATGWTLLTIVDEAEVYREATTLAERFTQVGYLLIAGLVVFYLCFFAYMWRRSISMSRSISTPLQRLNQLMAEIGRERYEQPLPRFTLLELQQSAEEVVQMGEALGCANRAKNQFLSSISHELRTPMTSIIGFAQLLKSSDQLTEEDQECLDEILHSGGHLLRLINDVLELAQVQSESNHIPGELVEVRSVVSSALRISEPQARGKEIALHVSPAPENEALEVFADGSRLCQVLINLMSNAIKYNNPGGEVQVRWFAKDETTLRIEVQDNGVGIGSEKLSELFQPFNRLGYETSNIQGTGIGLTISKRLIELMGGDIGCDTEEGSGSTFWLDLPRGPQEE